MSKGNGWINVKDKLPENQGRYLVYDKESEHDIAYFCEDDSGKAVWQLDSYCSLPEVTHWQPLTGKPIEIKIKGIIN
jgi:hypothetical protein